MEREENSQLENDRERAVSHARSDRDILQEIEERIAFLDVQEARIRRLSERIAELESRHTKPIEPQPDLEPDAHWSFAALPRDTDLLRILSEAEVDGARAVGVRLCGVPQVWIRRDVVEAACGSSVLTGSVLGGVRLANDKWFGWNVTVEPAQFAKRILAEIDEWAGKKHRTTVSCWK